ncbi:hypothetical protein MTO96_026399 [Rhipicephalus appendiculatus]
MMANKFASRTFDVNKSHRRQQKYQTLVEELLERSDGSDRRLVEQDGLESLPEDHVPHTEKEPTDPRRVIAEKRMVLVTKPPPRVFQAYGLWEITKRFLDAKHVGPYLDSYFMEVCTEVERVPKHTQGATAPGSRHKRKRREYAL